jgi:hypothetical protein
LVHPSSVPLDKGLATTLDHTRTTVRHSPWPTANAQLRELVAREGRIRRQGDQLLLRELVTMLADALGLAQGGSEQPFAQVLAQPQLWAPAATWLERGLALVCGIHAQ